ncbi:hypothetical protein [Saccharopolyspora sp. NPDC002376]
MAWETDRARVIREALSARQSIAVPLGCGLGLRQGEILGFSPDDIEETPDGKVVHIRRQVRPVNGALVFRLPKGRKTRVVPLSDELEREITEHADKKGYPATPVTLPWGEPDGKR